MPFTTVDAYAGGTTKEALRWAVKSGVVQGVTRGVYIAGGVPPTSIERAVAEVVAADGVANGSLAGHLHELDGVALRPPFVTVPSGNGRRRNVRHFDLQPDAIERVRSVRCTDGVQTLFDLAQQLNDLEWEQALESALRKRLLTVSRLEVEMEARRSQRVSGIRLMRRVLALRPPNAPPTESMLETLCVQLIRTEPRLAAPTRQVQVFNRHDVHVARVDLAWPDYGVFLELDGEQHKDQPRYDAARQTAVVAATGWLPGRFTWTDITRQPNTTLRRLLELFDRGTERAQVG